MDLLTTASRIGVEGFLHPEELEKLSELATNREVLEVGSFRGLSAWGMAITAKSVLCVDTFEAATDGQRQTGGVTTLADFVRATARFANVSHIRSTSQAAADLPETQRQFGMIFIDAMHTYEDVKGDIQRWYPRLESGGVFVMHDYGHEHFPGVKQAADELLGPVARFNTVISLMWLYKP